MIYTNRTISFDAIDCFASLKDLVFEEEALSAGAKNLAMQFYIHFKGHRSLVTEDGTFCIGPEQAREHDSVVILQGVSVPLLIRERDNGRCRIIGPVYAEGIMDGTFMRERLEQLEVFKIE